MEKSHGRRWQGPADPDPVLFEALVLGQPLPLPPTADPKGFISFAAARRRPSHLSPSMSPALDRESAPVSVVSPVQAQSPKIPFSQNLVPPDPRCLLCPRLVPEPPQVHCPKDLRSSWPLLPPLIQPNKFSRMTDAPLSGLARPHPVILLNQVRMNPQTGPCRFSVREPAKPAHPATEAPWTGPCPFP